jgi:hypothetical protein
MGIKEPTVEQHAGALLLGEAVMKLIGRRVI